MNRLTIVYSVFIAIVLAFPILAAEPSAASLRKMTIQARQSEGFKSDSVGTPLKVIDLSSRKQDFWLIPVLREGRLVAVFRDDPRRESVTEIASTASLRTAKSQYFSTENVAAALNEHGIEQSNPVLVTCGPISALGATNCGWFQRVGDSFVLFSLSGKLISEAEVEQFWPERLAALRAFRK